MNFATCSAFRKTHANSDELAKVIKDAVEAVMRL